MREENILVIGNEQELKNVVQTQVTKNNYQIFMAETGTETEHILKKEDIDLILLDINLTGENAVEFCRRIREQVFIPIIFVSWEAEREMVVKALKSGGDDFVTLPVDTSVFLARIESQIRRSKQYQKRIQKDIRTFQQFKINLSRHQVWKREENGAEGERLHLSPTEYKLLEMFIGNVGKLLTYEEIYRYVWKTDDLGDVRTVMVHVSNLRRKINYLESDMIQTVRGTGYVFYDR